MTDQTDHFTMQTNWYIHHGLDVVWLKICLIQFGGAGINLLLEQNSLTL